jgi:hypothetical protein
LVQANAVFVIEAFGKDEDVKRNLELTLLGVFKNPGISGLKLGTLQPILSF